MTTYEPLRESSLRPDLRRIVLIILVVKLYTLCLLYALFTKTDVRNGDKGFFHQRYGQPIEERCDEIQAKFWERLAPYDGQYYLDIAANGYRAIPRNSPSWRDPPGNYAFFPLLPSLLWLSNLVSNEIYLPLTILCLLILSSVGSLFVWLMAKELDINPALTLSLLLAFPTAVFQVILYTEGAFLCASALTLYFARKRKLVPAVLAGALAGLSRPQGVLLLVPLFIEFVLPVLRGREQPGRAALARRLVLMLSPLSGFLALSVFSASLTGSPTSFLAIQDRWGRSYELWNPFLAIAGAFAYGGPKADLIALAFGLALVPTMWRRLPPSLAYYGIVMLLLPLSTGSLMSLGRFLSVSIPHFLALASLLERTSVVLRCAVVTSFATCQVLVANGLIAWYLVG